MIDRLANIQSEESILEAAHQDLSTIASRLQEAAGRSNRIVKRKAEIQDINHESSTPFRNKVADGDLVQSALQVLSCSVQASKRDRNPSSDLTMATENAAVDCAVSMQADLNREVDYGELMIVDSDGNTIIDCMGITAVDSKTANLGIMVTPTVDSDAAKTACAVSTTVDHNSKSEIDHVAGNTLNEPVYPGGRVGIPHQAGNIIPIEIVAETQAHLRLRISNDIFDAEQALRTFDNALLWGPKSSVTRFERLARLRNYSTPAGWEWVDSILERFPALGDLKAHEQYREHEKSIAAGTSKLKPETRSTRGMSEIGTPEIFSTAPAVHALGPVVLAAQHSHSYGQQPCKTKEPGTPLFTHTLPNVGNTCFFNSVLQVIASIPSFVAEIEKAPLPPNFDDSSYCMAFLKLFIPAIAAPSSEPSIKLDMSSVKNGDWRMCHADWVDFVLRLTTKYDSKYALGAFADPGDLLDYFLSIVSGAGHMCSIDFKWITTLRCQCQEQQR
jgi:hypothetical protein